MDAECLTAMRTHSWSGNVREPRNAVQRAMIERRRGYLGVGNLLPSILRLKSEVERMVFNIGTSLAEIERETILRTFHATGGNHRRMARILGILSGTLYETLAKCGLRADDGRFDLSNGSKPS